MLHYSSMIPNQDRSGSVFAAGQFLPLTRTHVTDTICRLLWQAGFHLQSYSSHSFRIGAATTAAVEGFPAWLIKSLGRWSSEAYLTYVHCAQEVVEQYPSIFARANVTHQQPLVPDEHYSSYI